MFQRISYVAIFALFALGAFGWWQWYSDRSSARDNIAVVDATATKTVQAHVSQALTRLLSFSHTDPSMTETAAADLLIGQAREEFDQLFADMLKSADGQELELSATVRAVGVKELDEDSAELLVFLDQYSERVGDEERSISAAQIGVTAERDGSDWIISGITIR